jgi:uncharacterized protein
MNAKTVRGIYEAFERGDVPAMLEHIGEDCLWEYQPITNTVPILQARRGRAGVAEFFQTVAAELTITKFALNNVLDGGQTVVALIDLDGTYKRSGRSFREIDEAHVWHFDERGRVVKFRHCHDTHAHQLAWQP